jgi:hypothetical protein
VKGALCGALGKGAQEVAEEAGQADREGETQPRHFEHNLAPHVHDAIAAKRLKLKTSLASLKSQALVFVQHADFLQN